MKKGEVFQKSPMEVELEEGKTYAWCSCGKSKTQPYCDGSHTGTEFKPVIFKAEKSSKQYLCGCKQTDNQPYCDGTHRKI
ncbi:MAG: CDGSH iron-sulfur domain-containing protein [Candidatus Izemoplasma sp.]